MAKRELYKISGHWDHYRDGMFVLGDRDDQDDPEEVLALRPMTRPFQFQAYLTQTRSYRDLPLRYNETSTLFRNEASGEMHGLIRLRQFTISEGHLACTPEQLESEFAGCLELAKYMLTTLGLEEDVFYRFSKWDKNDRQKYIGSEEAWEAAQDTMRRILNDLHIDYYEADGEAAFYGPKLDIQIKNVHGKEDTLITIQIDFQLAEKFGMEYVDRDNKRKYPYVIHRTSIGCYERTLALLIEKYAGAFPLWLAPEQARVILISDDQKPYAEEVLRTLKAAGLRASLDDRNEKLGFKIREAQLEKLPYMLIVGGKEAENGTVGVRSRKGGRPRRDDARRVHRKSGGRNPHQSQITVCTTAKRGAGKLFPAPRPFRNARRSARRTAFGNTRHARGLIDEAAVRRAQPHGFRVRRESTVPADVAARYCFLQIFYCFARKNGI